MMKLLYVLPLFWLFACKTAQKGSIPPSSITAVIAYYHGKADAVDQFRADQLTHIIYSFCHLRGNELAVDDAADSLTIRRLMALKQKNPRLKVLLSLGGWGGCETCSPVFAGAAARQAFAVSVKRLLLQYQCDGIDLDWEYPAIEGYPGHVYAPADKHNFTLLVQELRRVLGTKYEISFAAGGFQRFFDQSVEWAEVMPLLDRVNVMSYDLVSGFSTRTGHHTPLYSSPGQRLSADYGVRYLDSIGVPKQKIVIGAAFYARTWEQVPNVNHGLYQPGKFKAFVSYRQFETVLTAENGFVFYRDPVAQAPYAYSATLGQFATFDDKASVALKTKYVREKGLGGIMFWQLGSDTDSNGLLQAIFDQCDQ